MNGDGTGVEPLIELEHASLLTGDPLAGARWSPDGSMVAFVNTSDSLRSWIEVMNADGTGRRRLYGDSGATWEWNPSWSPDGTRIAFERWETDDHAFEGAGMPGGVIDVRDGTFRTVGPAAGTGVGAWSPDGTSLVAIDHAAGRLILIDPDDGTWQHLEESTDSSLTWQRLAP
jgi:Tol biopolymer transport system component